MSFQPGATLYTQGFGSRPEGVEVPHIERRSPSTTDILYPIGKRWLNLANEQEFILYSFSTVNGVTSANWSSPVGASGAVDTLSDNSNTKVSPDGTGNIQLFGDANQVTAISNPGANSVNLGLSSSMVAPGSLTVTNGFQVATGAVIINPTLLNIDSSSGASLNMDSNGNTSLNPDDGSDVSIGFSSTGGEVFLGNATTTQMHVEAVEIDINTTGSGNTIIGNLGASTLLLQAGSGNVQVAGVLESNSGSLVIGSPLSVNNGLKVANNVINPPSYVQQVTDVFLDCATSAAISIQLINMPSGTILIIADTEGLGATNNITVNAPGGQSINFSGGVAGPTAIINANFGSLTMIVASNNYYVLAQG